MKVTHLSDHPPPAHLSGSDVSTRRSPWKPSNLTHTTRFHNWTVRGNRFSIIPILNFCTIDTKNERATRAPRRGLFVRQRCAAPRRRRGPNVRQCGPVVRRRGPHVRPPRPICPSANMLAAARANRFYGSPFFIFKLTISRKVPMNPKVRGAFCKIVESPPQTLQPPQALLVSGDLQREFHLLQRNALVKRKNIRVNSPLRELVMKYGLTLIASADSQPFYE